MVSHLTECLLSLYYPALSFVTFSIPINDSLFAILMDLFTHLSRKKDAYFLFPTIYDLKSC